MNSQSHQGKRIMDFVIVENRHIHSLYSLLILETAAGAELPSVEPGQFVQVAVPGSRDTFLRRPISINYVDPDRRRLWLLVRRAGEGTAALISMHAGERLNIVLPLGRGFTMPEVGERVLLVGGGVGVAPLLYLGYRMREVGVAPHFLLGARTVADLLEVEQFEALGEVSIATDDGSAGVKGVVTCHPVMNEHFDRIYCCGPSPMMKAVAASARRSRSACEVSLENMMACGIGACLCCVEKTVKGNVCVCTEGPVFNTDQLTW